MAETPESRLKALGIELHDLPAPAANYIPSVRVGSLLFVSGQVSGAPGVTIKGKLGQNMNVEQGQEAARVCAINLLANFRAALGDLGKVKRVVKLTGFVNCTPDFEDAHKVINGCSDLLTDVLGERGKHARSAIGMASLPLGYAVEVEAIVEVD
jgi:enamine deaminase RidA (YjgF/YER057c/UK114 family)